MYTHEDMKNAFDPLMAVCNFRISVSGFSVKRKTPRWGSRYGPTLALILSEGWARSEVPYLYSGFCKKL